MGLGNPGAAYAVSRHNAGFMAVETLADRWRIVLAEDATVCAGQGVIAGQPAMLLAPQTFMNRSGDVLAETAPDADDTLVVVHDDLDIPAGQLRVRPRGGSGGHRGVESITARIGGDFIRVRVGVGRPPAGVETADYVLAPLSSAERDVLRATVGRACDAVECLVVHGVDVTMNRFNSGVSSGEPSQTTKE